MLFSTAKVVFQMSLKFTLLKLRIKTISNLLWIFLYRTKGVFMHQKHWFKLLTIFEIKFNTTRNVHVDWKSQFPIASLGVAFHMIYIAGPCGIFLSIMKDTTKRICFSTMLKCLYSLIYLECVRTNMLCLYPLEQDNKLWFFFFCKPWVWHVQGKEPEETAQIYFAHQLGNILMVNNICIHLVLIQIWNHHTCWHSQRQCSKLGFHLDISWWKCIL